MGISSLQPLSLGVPFIVYLFRFPDGGLGNQNPARTIALSPLGVKETLNYMLRDKYPKQDFFFPQHIVEGLLNSRRWVSDRPSWILISKTPARKRTIDVVILFLFPEQEEQQEEQEEAHGPWPRAHGPWPMAQGPWPKAHGPGPTAHGSKIHYISSILALMSIL